MSDNYKVGEAITFASLDELNNQVNNNLENKIMKREITLTKDQLADIMLGSVIAAMKDVAEPERLAMRDEHIAHYRKLAQDIINKHGEEEAPKILIPH